MSLYPFFSMRIACLQFNPHLGDVNNNLTRADRVLGRANPENLDLIVLPEMAFTGKRIEVASRDWFPHAWRNRSLPVAFIASHIPWITLGSMRWLVKRGQNRAALAAPSTAP